MVVLCSFCVLPGRGGDAPLHALTHMPGNACLTWHLSGDPDLTTLVSACASPAVGGAVVDDFPSVVDNPGEIAGIVQKIPFARPGVDVFHYGVAKSADGGVILV